MEKQQTVNYDQRTLFGCQLLSNTNSSHIHKFELRGWIAASQHCFRSATRRSRAKRETQIYSFNFSRNNIYRSITHLDGIIVSGFSYR